MLLSTFNERWSSRLSFNTCFPLFSGNDAASALILTLNIEQYENMLGPHFAAGLKILMYDETDIPVFEGQGQGLAAGFHTFAGTKVTVVGFIKI